MCAMGKWIKRHWWKILVIVAGAWLMLEGVAKVRSEEIVGWQVVATDGDQSYRLCVAGENERYHLLPLKFEKMASEIASTLQSAGYPGLIWSIHPYTED